MKAVGLVKSIKDGLRVTYTLAMPCVYQFMKCPEKVDQGVECGKACMNTSDLMQDSASLPEEESPVVSELAKFVLIVAVFLSAYYVPFGDVRVQGAILEAFNMLQDYAREHVQFCIVPAFFIAGAM